MRSVTFKELAAWLVKNKHRTWHYPVLGKRPSLEIKYLQFSIDTRDMCVWRLDTQGMGKSHEIVIRDTKDDGDWTILDELEKQLDAPDKAGGQNETT